MLFETHYGPVILKLTNIQGVLMKTLHPSKVSLILKDRMFYNILYAERLKFFIALKEAMALNDLS